RKQRDEERVAQGIALRRQVTAVDVDGLRDPLERVEADPDRQDDSVQESMEPGKAVRGDHAYEARQVAAHEGRVLERPEQGEQRRDDQRQHGLAAVALERTPAGVADER